MSTIISSCERYRYRLDREFLFAGATITFMLHNPSTADATVDDPTLRRGIGFARAWGAGRLVFVNVWAGRATKPEDLWRMDDPVGPENDRYIAEAVQEVRETGGLLVMAWGAINPPRDQRADALARLETVQTRLTASGCELVHLGLTKAGQPRHPLYLRADVKPTRWEPAR
jgi:hypothetical protein